MAAPGTPTTIPAAILNHPRTTISKGGAELFCSIDLLTQQAERDSVGSSVALLAALAALGVPTTEAAILAAAKNADVIKFGQRHVDAQLTAYQGITG